MSEVIVITSGKGGVGKTTTSINLSAALGILGKKVLVIDFDPQGNTTSGLGFDKRTVSKSSYDVLEKDTSAEEATLETQFKNLYLIPSHINLASADAGISLFSGKESKLKNKISHLKEIYDYIIIDCPPSLGVITLNSLCAADSVLIPIQCEYYALEGLSKLTQTIKNVKQSLNPSLKIEGILLTMYDGRTKLSGQVTEEVRKYFGATVYKTVIPRNVRLSEAPSFGQPIIAFDKNSKGAKCYKKLANEVINRNK